MPTNVSAPEPLTIDKDGKPPVHRIQSSDSMWGAFQDALAAAMVDDIRFASIRGQYDGMPPVDPSELERQGLKDVPNFNTRQMTAKISTYVSTYVDLNTKGERMAEVQLKRKNFESSQEWKTANQLVTECYNDSIKLWDSPEEQNLSQFIFTRVMCDTQMGIFGIGVLHFADPIDWRPCFVPTRKVYPSRGTKITLDNCQSLFIEKEYTVARLYSFVKNEDATGKKWNRKAMLDFLYNYSRQPRAGTTDMFEGYAEWENRVRNNDLFLRLDFRLLPLVHCYIQEFDVDGHGDGITHYIIPRLGTNQRAFLYESDREYERWTQIIIPFCDSTGPEGDWHGVKGFGDQIFDGCHFANCFFNATALASMMSMFPMFKSSDETDREKLNQIVFSRLGVLYPGINLEQLQIKTDITGALAVMGENNRIINQNSRMFPQNESRAGGEQPTATQVTFDRQDQAQFTSLQVQFYRSTGDDRIYGEMYKRITAKSSDYPAKWPGGGTAKRFREKMEEYGITPKQYQEVDYVRASRTGGTGNMALDAQKSDQVFGVATPGQGQMNARKEKVAALYGWDRVAEFIEEVPMPIPEDALIGLENTTLQNGQFVDAYPFQMHERHLGEPNPEGNGHLAVLMATQQAAVQIDTMGVENALQDAVKIDKVLQMTLQHALVHVQFLEQMPANKEVAKQLRQFLNQFVQFGKQFTKSIEKAVAKQQESQGQMSPEVQAKMAETQAKIAAIKAESDAEIQKMLMVTKAKIEAQALTAASRRGLKEDDHALKMGMDAETALIENQRKAQDLKFDAVQKLQDIGATAAKTRAQANAKKTNGNKQTE